MKRFAITFLPLILLFVMPASPLFAMGLGHSARNSMAEDKMSILPYRSTISKRFSPAAAQNDQLSPTTVDATWQQLQLPTAVTTATINTLVVHPLDANILYLATTQGLYRSSDAGTSWGRFNNLDNMPIFELAQAEADPQRLYIRSWKSYRSEDGGATWQEFTTPDQTCGFVVAPSQANRLYARRCAPADLPPVVRSDDGGKSWIIPTSTLTEAFSVMAVAPDQPDTLIASNFEQTWRSTDGGNSWTQALISVRYGGIPLFDRQSPPTLYLGHRNGLLRSQDAGATWEDSDTVREFSTLVPWAKETGVVVGGNADATWHFQATNSGWQAATWQVPTTLTNLWGSANDPQLFYARSASGLWRLDLRQAPTFTPTDYLYLPLVQMTKSTVAAQSATCLDGCQRRAQNVVAEFIAEAETVIDVPGSPSEQAVTRANYYRAIVGTIPLQLHPTLVDATANHTNYRLQNYADSSAMIYGAHGEVEGKPGFTGQWPKDRIATTNYPWWGGAEVMHGLGDPVASVDDWVATVYHRFPILEPYNHYVGYAHHTGTPMAVDVMDFGAGPTAEGLWMPATPYPLAYPADGQTDVPTGWSGAESPNPLPDGVTGPVGYPFTLQAIGGKLTMTRAELHTADGTLVATHPNPADCAAGRCLALIAVAPLAPHTSYVVTAAGDVSGVPFQREWHFTTGADNTTAAAAAVSAELKSVYVQPMAE